MPSPASDLSPQAFAQACDFFYRQSGIRLTEQKRQLVVGRLAGRAAETGHASMDAFVQQALAQPNGPLGVLLVDALTTNETYFFREPQHFDHLSQWVRQYTPGGRALRVWSAAASTGEEAYSIAMTLAAAMGSRPWEVVGTDLSSRVLAQARQGLYHRDRCAKIPPADLKRWCLKGHGTYSGQVLMTRELRAKVRFEPGNLMHAQPDLGVFDVIFLRNVLIYFEGDAKATVVRHVVQRLARSGVLYTGHAETLNGLDHPLVRLAPAIYQLQ